MVQVGEDIGLLTPIAYSVYCEGLYGKSIEKTMFFGEQNFQVKEIMEYF